ncbi:MAG: hypothetical protein ACRDIL_17380 [Candidatus Limnocylindrales bacterium]
MTSLLIRCYPATWRARYGDEFEALLDERPLGPLDVADILLGAFDAQLRLRGHETAIAHGKGFIVSLRIGGIAAILGAALWAAAGLVNSGIFADADATLPSVMLVAGLPIWLVAMAGLSAFQARTNPTLSWVAFLVPAVGAVACLVGMVGIAAGGDELFWLMFGLGSLTAIVGSTLFAIATYRTAALSRAGAALLGAGSIVTLLTISNPSLQTLAAVGLAAFALGWFALGVQAVRLDRPATAPRPA